jgi:hypothetical protein
METLLRMIIVLGFVNTQPSWWLAFRKFSRKRSRYLLTLTTNRISFTIVYVTFHIYFISGSVFTPQLCSKFLDFRSIDGIGDISL